MLLGLGVRPGARVLLLIPESPAFVASLLGAIKAGAVPIVGARAEGDDIDRCIGATTPAAAIVHESRLPVAEAALARIGPDAIVVVGPDAHGYTAFVDAVRVQPSWLASESIAPEAPALGIWNGRLLELMSHADVGRFVGDAAFAGDGVAEAARVAAMLRAFASGDAVTLKAS